MRHWPITKSAGTPHRASRIRKTLKPRDCCRCPKRRRNCSQRCAGARKTLGCSTWRGRGLLPPSASSIPTTCSESWRLPSEVTSRRLLSPSERDRQRPSWNQTDVLVDIVTTRGLFVGVRSEEHTSELQSLR